MSEQPAATINCGYDDEGLPIGLQIVGRRFDDVGVLGLAMALEAMRAGQARAWPEPPPDP
jgi:Asp-tRNA(Asn)/Glu-tRNA(Gln) amidotransferase A subunit family amidase